MKSEKVKTFPNFVREDFVIPLQIRSTQDYRTKTVRVFSVRADLYLGGDELRKSPKRDFPTMLVNEAMY